MKVKVYIIVILLTLFTAIFVKSNAGEELYDFRLGSHNIGGNAIKFEFPGDVDTLYLFNLEKWVGPRPDKAELVVKIYDGNRSLIASGESVCVSKSFPSFGSISLNDISKGTVQDAVYFSLSVKGCAQ